MMRGKGKIFVGLLAFSVSVGPAKAGGWFLAAETGVCEPIAQLGTSTPEALDRQLRTEGSYIEWLDGEPKDKFYEEGYSEESIRVGLIHGQFLSVFLKGRSECEKFINQ